MACEKLVRLHQTMAKLVPQIRYWLKTGYVAADKIISLHIPELYSIVRGKVGKTVEFGLNWGITRLRGGFLLARLALDRRELQDTNFVVKSVEDHIALFGKAPRAYAYDRGGYGAKKITTLKKRGAQVEGGIGAVKSSRYNFHRPRARSVRMMGACGQLAVLAFNLNKLVRGLAARKEVEVVG